jgi:hypothetical protein
MAMTGPQAGLKSTRGQIAFVMCHEVLGAVWFVATAGIQRRGLQGYPQWERKRDLFLLLHILEASFCSMCVCDCIT